MEVSFTPPLSREEEVTIVSAKVINSDSGKNFIQLVGRSAITGSLMVAQCSKKALGVNYLTRGASVLLIGENRIANVTSYKDETGAVKTHESTAYHVSNIISLEESDDIDFDTLFASSAEPEVSQQ